jgi:hypothetical protein
METLGTEEPNLCWLQQKYFSWQQWTFFTLCSAQVSVLVIVLRGSPSERISKWEACLILKEYRLSVCL